MKNSNFPILIVVILAVAVAAQFSRHSGEKPEWTAMRQDMVKCLHMLWDKGQHQVELTPVEDGVDVKATLALQPSTRLREQRWSHPFLRFVALRHPSVTMKSLHVLNGSNHQGVPEFAMNGLMADVAAPRANPVQDEEAFCQLNTRQLTSALDRLMGAGHGIVLLDAQMAQASREGIRYGEPNQKLARVASPAGRVSNGVVWMAVTVVVNAEIPADQLKIFEYHNLPPGTNFRVITLPKL